MKPRNFFFLILNTIVFSTLLLSCAKDTPNTPDPNIYAPIAGFEYTLNPSGTLVKVNFTNTSQNADKYHWDFGDGTTSTQASPEKIYPKPVSVSRQYTVVLTAYDTVNSTLNRKSRILTLNP